MKRQTYKSLNHIPLSFPAFLLRLSKKGIVRSGWPIPKSSASSTVCGNFSSAVSGRNTLQIIGNGRSNRRNERLRDSRDWPRARFTEHLHRLFQTWHQNSNQWSAKTCASRLNYVGSTFTDVNLPLNLTLAPLKLRHRHRGCRKESRGSTIPGGGGTWN